MPLDPILEETKATVIRVASALSTGIVQLAPAQQSMLQTAAAAAAVARQCLALSGKLSTQTKL